MKLLNWLDKPYPLIEQTKSKLLLILSFVIFVCLFLLIFQPFGARQQVIEGKAYYLLGFGIMVGAALFINYVILPKVFKSIFRPEKWQIKKEIVFLIWTFCLIAVFNYVYNTAIIADKESYRSLSEFLGITIAIGIFPVIILIFLVERNLTGRNTQKAERLQDNLTLKVSEHTIKDTSLIIQPETSKTTPITIELSHFLFATSSNNYTTLYFLENEVLTRKLIRLSLKNLAQQLVHIPQIIRCHRSYLVNKQKISAVQGNARSLVLKMDPYEEAIPVSRSLSKSFL